MNPLTAAAEAALARLPDGPVLLYDGRWWTASELHEEAVRWAGGLVARGLEPGDRVLLLLPNAPEVGIAYEAVWRAGGVVVPVLFLAGPTDLSHALQDSGSRFVVTVPGLLPGVLTAAGDDVTVVLVGAESDDPRVVPSQELGGACEPVDGDEGTLAALLYTGGTTGRSKGVTLTHGNLAAVGRGAVEAGYVPGVTRFLSVLPLAHVYGLMISIAGLMVPEQRTSVVLPWFAAKDALDAIEEHRIQQVAVVPSMLALMLAEGLEGRDLSSLRYVTSGGGPLPAEVARAFTEALPGVELLEGYGATETCALCTTSRPGTGVPGTVGRAAPGYVVRVVDDEDHEVAVGEVGEVVVQGPGVTLGYWRDEEASRDALRGGWLHTGDLGTLDDTGLLRIVDRKKDLIIRGGFNVYPRDVEEVLLQHPDVTAAAVVGRPDPVRGEEVVAVVSVVDGSELTPTALVAWSKSQMSSAKYPREIRIVDSVPLTAVGKTDRKAVRAALASP